MRLGKFGINQTVWCQLLKELKEVECRGYVTKNNSKYSGVEQSRIEYGYPANK